MRSSSALKLLVVMVSVATVTAMACGGTDALSAGAAVTGGLQEADETSVQIPNLPPRIDSVRLSASEVIPGATLTALVEVHDPEGQDVELGYTWHIGAHRFSGGGSSIEVPSTAKHGDMIRVSVKASDSRLTTKPTEATAEVENSPPVWREIALVHGARVASGSEITMHAIADDHDGDEVAITTQWYVNKRRVQNYSAVFNTSELRRGDVVHATVHASDGDLEAPERESEGVVLENSDPTFISAPGTLSQDGKFKYEPKLQDPDGDRHFRFSLASAPPDMTIDSSFGVVTWTATEKHQGLHQVEIVADDRHGGEARQQFDLTVRVNRNDASPASPDAYDADDDE
jgi:hypothetical protein